MICISLAAVLFSVSVASADLENGSVPFRKKLIAEAQGATDRAQWAEASKGWSAVLAAEASAEERFKAVRNWANAASKVGVAGDERVRVLENVVSLVRDTKDAGRVRFLEVLMRDSATRLQEMARDTKVADQGIENFRRATRAYDLYELAFPENLKAPRLMLNRAEALFGAHLYARAGIEFERLAGLTKEPANQSSLQQSALQSYLRALALDSEASPLDRFRSRRALREIGPTWADQHPSSRAASDIYYGIGQSWYDENDYEKSADAFRGFLAKFRTDSKRRDARAMILNADSQLEDFDRLIADAVEFDQAPDLTATERSGIREAAQRAQLKKAQIASGGFGSKAYAKTLIDMAGKNADPQMGLLALSEAFNSLTSKNDLALFTAGEKLVAAFPDSKEARESLEVMTHVALVTADFVRAANLLVRLSDATSTKDLPDSVRERRRTAALIYERLGSYRNAKKYFDLIGDKVSAARCERLAYDESEFSRSDTSESRAAAGMISGFEKSFSAFQKIPANALPEKIKGFQSLTTALSNFVKTPVAGVSPRWTIAALYILAQTNRELGLFIAATPNPPDLKPAELKAYHTELAKQSGTYAKAATAGFARCTEAAERGQVFSAYVGACRTQAAVTSLTDRVVPISGAPKLSADRQREINGLRAKLLASPDQVDLLVKMAGIYLGSADYGMATAIYDRILEIQAKNGDAIAALGLVRFYRGDFQGAAGFFGQALALNPKNAIALWNQAALDQKFGFEKTLQVLLKRARKVPRPALVHPSVAKLSLR